MAYQTYITDALVCATRDSNTSDRSYLLFAREAGMVWATARSVREERSKQRFALQDFSLLRATLVRGKGGWKIAGVEPISSAYYGHDNRESRTFVRNIIRLLRRVMQGEEANTDLFDEVLLSLAQKKIDDPHGHELALSLRILWHLGYVDRVGLYARLLETGYRYQDEGFSKEDENAVKEAISKALISSQL